jgi:hypothetical protein
MDGLRASLMTFANVTSDRARLARHARYYLSPVLSGFAPRALKQGERLHMRGKVVYTLRKGRFTLINDGAR